MNHKPAPATARPSVYASVGAKLTHYDLDTASASLNERATLTLPCAVQYIWPHPELPYLYAACSNGSPYAGGDAHCLVALRRDTATGQLSVHGSPVPLSARPIHMTLDANGSHALVAYNKPSSLSVHRIGQDGTIGAVVPQQQAIDAGIYAHQVRVSPSGKAAIIVARGNKAKDATPEDPGALKVFSYADGRLAPSVTVAPNGGYGFGPRHLDFHPTQPWVYVSLETQSLLHMFRMNSAGDKLEAEPAYVSQMLADKKNECQRQRSGTIHMHPNGRFVYAANRASGVTEVDGQSIYVGGENNIAVFAIDQQTGELTVIQHADTHGIVPRTFALDKSGRFMVVANSMPILTREGGSVTTIPASLAVFRVQDDGRLEYCGKRDVDIGKETMFWMGVIS